MHRMMIGRWQHYLDQGIDHLIEVWQQQKKDLNFKQLVGWRPQVMDTPYQAPDVANPKPSAYQRMMQLVAGWH